VIKRAPQLSSGLQAVRSSQLWWNKFDRIGKNLMKVWFHRTMLDRCARGISAEIIITPPVVDRADRSRTKSAAAIRANIVQDLFDAGPAEGAFKRADHRVCGIWGKSGVAILASRSEFEHNTFQLFEFIGQ